LGLLFASDATLLHDQIIDVPSPANATTPASLARIVSITLQNRSSSPIVV